MKAPRPLYLCLTLLFTTCTMLHAQGNSHGPESPVVVGTITEILENGDVIVKQKAGGHRRHLTFKEDSRVYFHYFRGVGMENVDQPAPGFVVKARAKHEDGIDIVGRIDYSPHLPEDRPIADRLELSPDDLFDRTDHNQNGEVDYVEYSLSIARSEKHFAAGFNTADMDKDDVLNRAEFAEALHSVSWWKRAQKTVTDWLKEADADADGVLSPREFKTFSGKEAHFRRTDKDQSGGISLKELANYLPTAQRGDD